jgi:hypothetical protein
MRQNKTIAGLAALVAVGAWASLYLLLHGTGPTLKAGPHEALGRVMAQQALSLVRPQGQIIVLARDTTAFENPASEIQLAAFKKTILKAHGAIRTIKWLQVDPLRPVQVPSGDFFELLRRVPEGDVVVSFMGPPLLTQVQRSQLGNIKPAVVAFCSGSLPELIDLKLLFEEGVLSAAVVAKGNSPHLSSKTLDKEKVGQVYLTVTRTNLSDLPSGPAAGSD